MTEALWTEKYRPSTINECILNQDLKNTFNSIVKTGTIPNLLLTGTAGTGKTTVAKALCNTLGLDWILINGSEESGIDVLRNKIKQFASSISLQGGVKVVILDEADYLNAQSTQPALRGFIEEFSSNCRFILTCNFKNRIIEPLHSRCSVVEFNTSRADLSKLGAKFLTRLRNILDNENVKYEIKVLVELIIRYAPDWRRIIGECQRYGASGEIPSSILVGLGDETYGEFLNYLKDKNFKSMRSWIAQNCSTDSTALFRKIYNTISEHAEPGSVPAAILILADYNYKAAFVSDRELNAVACCTELMANVVWKK